MAKEPPREMFRTLLGLGVGGPPPLPAELAPPTSRSAPAAAPPLPVELSLQLQGMRRELVYFRKWWPEQLAAAGLVPRPRGKFSPVALAAGILLGLALGLVSAAAALGWPAYGRLVARIAHVGAPPAPGLQR